MPGTGRDLPVPTRIDQTAGRFKQQPPPRHRPANPLVAPGCVPLLAGNPRRLHVQRIGLVPITAPQPCRQAIPHRPQPDEPGGPRRRIAHPPPPIAPRIGIGTHGSVQPPPQPRVTSYRPQIFQAPSSSLAHQDPSIPTHCRGIAPMAPRTRQIAIRQPADAQSMIALGQQGQAPMSRQGLVRPFQLEGPHRVSYPHRTLSVTGCVWRYTCSIRAQRGRPGLFLPTTRLLSLF